MHEEPVYRGIVGIDIERFARAEWTDPVRARLRGRLYRLVDDAIAHAEIAPSLTARNDIGDGLLVLVDAAISTARLLHPLATSLAGGLADDNQQVPRSERMRLRVVVHAGEALQDAHGHTGASLNHAARLLDAEATRAVLAGSPAAEMVLVVSDVVHEGVMRHAYQGIDPAGWQPVRIHTKETSTRAWVHLPGLSVQPHLPPVLVAPRVGPASLPIPRELPRPPGDFTGRTKELATLHGLLDGGASDVPDGGEGSMPPAGPGRPVVISAIDGMGGIGKSALAIQAANQLALRFPDGQLYVNLQGATPGLAPLEPLDALGRMLRSLGLDPNEIPAEVEEAAARFRSLAAERRLLVLLDNAASARQVRPLLPGSPDCLALITSRTRLTGLEGVRILDLEVLDASHAIELLAKLAGPQRVAAEPEAAATIARVCGCLPLALRVAGAKLAGRPNWRLARLADRLGDERRRLVELHAADLDVRPSFGLSYQGQGDPERRMFRLLGLLSIEDFPVGLAAALLDTDPLTAEDLLERLVDAQLLEAAKEDAIGQLRYRFHDLLRLFARERAEAEDQTSERYAAMGRALEWYLAGAEQANELLTPSSLRRGDRDAPMFSERRAALAWLEAERANLVAAAKQSAAQEPQAIASIAWRLSDALFIFFDLRKHWPSWQAVCEAGVQAARRAGNRREEAGALNRLGVVNEDQGRLDAAIACYQQGLEIWRELGDRQGEAKVLNNLGIAYQDQGQLEEAIACYRQALAIFEEAGERSRYRLGGLLTNLGETYRRQGRLDQAMACVEQGLAIEQEIGDAQAEGEALKTLGDIYQDRGRLDEAIASYERSLALCREVGNRYLEGMSLWRLGSVVEATRGPEAARAYWMDAFAIFDSIGAPEAHDVQALLDNHVVARRGSPQR
jgi:tetratricopeptide (TPR) repeat protein